LHYEQKIKENERKKEKNEEKIPEE